MKIVYWVLSLSLICFDSFAQDIHKNLQRAALQFESDSQTRHAIYSLYVVEAKTGKVIFDKNSQIGLAPASCQKLFTSGAAFEMLGHDYRYKTQLAYEGRIVNARLNGNLFILGTGDPTLGSWRWKETADTIIFKNWLADLQKEGIKSIEGVITTNESNFSHQAIPGGWVWDDIGNYYGAGAFALNWKENHNHRICKFYHP